MNALSGMMGAGGGNNPGAGNVDLNAMRNLLGGMGGGMQPVQPVANPEEAYASQLTQLQVNLAAGSLQDSLLSVRLVSWPSHSEDSLIKMGEERVEQITLLVRHKASSPC